MLNSALDYIGDKVYKTTNPPVSDYESYIVIHKQLAGRDSSITRNYYKFPDNYYFPRLDVYSVKNFNFINKNVN